MSSRTRSVVVVLACWAGLFWPARAEPGWLPPQKFDDARWGSCPSVASAGENVLVVWPRYPDLAARWRLADGAFGPVRRLAGASGSCPALALGASGRAAVAWSDQTVGFFGEFHFYGVYLSVLDGADSPVSEPVHFAAEEELVAPPVVAVSPGGEVLVAWISYLPPLDYDRFVVKARVRSISGRWGPIRTLTDDSYRAYDLAVVYAADGTAILVWTRYDEAARTARIERVEKATGGPFGPIRPVSATVPFWYLFLGGHPQVATSPDGFVAIGWFEAFDRITRIRIRPPGGSFQPALPPLRQAPFLSALALGSGGKVLLAGIEYRPREPGGAFTRLSSRSIDPVTGEISDYSLTGWIPEYNEIAGTVMTSDGDAIVLMRLYGRGKGALFARRLKPGAGRFERVELISPPPPPYPSLPSVAVDTTGRVYALFSTFDPSPYLFRIELAEYSPAPRPSHGTSKEPDSSLPSEVPTGGTAWP